MYSLGFIEHYYTSIIGKGVICYKTVYIHLGGGVDYTSNLSLVYDIELCLYKDTKKDNNT